MVPFNLTLSCPFHQTKKKKSKATKSKAAAFFSFIAPPRSGNILRVFRRRGAVPCLGGGVGSFANLE